VSASFSRGTASFSNAQPLYYRGEIVSNYGATCFLLDLRSGSGTVNGANYRVTTVQNLSTSSFALFATSASYSMNGGGGGVATSITASDGFYPAEHWYFDGARWWSDTHLVGIPMAQFIGGTSPNLTLNTELNLYNIPGASAPFLSINDDPTNVNPYNLVEFYSGSHVLKAWIDRNCLFNGTASNALIASANVKKSGDNISGVLGIQGSINVGAGAFIEYNTGGYTLWDGAGFTVSALNTGLLSYAGPSGSIYFSGSNQGSIVSASLFTGTASYATTAGGSQTFAIATITASTGITCSFTGSQYQIVNITNSGSYAFTSSNVPTNGGAKFNLLFNNTSTGTSSLSFPAGWRCLSGGWPTQITASKIAELDLKSWNGTVVGGWIAEL
jgi:hypothetical protein